MKLIAASVEWISEPFKNGIAMRTVTPHIDNVNRDSLKKLALDPDDPATAAEDIECEAPS